MPSAATRLNEMSLSSLAGLGPKTGTLTHDFILVIIASNDNNDVLYSKGDYHTNSMHTNNITIRLTTSQAFKYCARPKPVICLILKKARAEIGQVSSTGKRWQYILSLTEACDWLMKVVER